MFCFVFFHQLISKMLIEKIEGLIFFFEVMTHKWWLHQAIFLIHWISEIKIKTTNPALNEFFFFTKNEVNLKNFHVL